MTVALCKLHVVKRECYDVRNNNYVEFNPGKRALYGKQFSARGYGQNGRRHYATDGGKTVAECRSVAIRRRVSFLRLKRTKSGCTALRTKIFQNEPT